MKLRIYLVGLGYMAVAGWAIRQSQRQFDRALPESEITSHVQTTPTVVGTDQTAEAWFQKIKPFCNTVEVETALQQSPPPASSGYASPGYQAGCLALAGRVAKARDIIAALPEELRWQAAGIVFAIAHPVADADDDKSAGPIMAMVVEFWPNHYMALYHAGMSEFATGEMSLAKTHLESFLRYYTAEDGWRTSALGALERIGR